MIRARRFSAPAFTVGVLSFLGATALAAAAPAPAQPDRPRPAERLPRLPPASGAPLLSCGDLAGFTYPATTITGAGSVPAGTLTVAGKPVPAHCRLTGSMYPRVSPVDGNNYAIGFEMRLPEAWNGRFFYQANGGIDGSVVTATGPVNTTSTAPDNALDLGFAVISSDAGHSGALGPFFGVDPQARLDYGYEAVAKLTPMAKAAIAAAYGKGPDRSYFGGCSNGGRHTMVAAARYPDDYDGYLVGDPGYRLPRAAVANIAGAQAYATLATNPADLSTGFTTAERALVSNAVLEKCDALDGAVDGLVQDTPACQAAFNFFRDVPTCPGARDGSCLSSAQKSTIARLFKGAVTSGRELIYSSFPYDAGLATGGFAFWKFSAPLQLDSGAVGFIFQTPPEAVAGFDGTTFALTAPVDSLVTKIAATNATYLESSLSFMQPPNWSDLAALKNRGAKMMLFHGTSDPIFSSDDTTAFYDDLRRENGGDASNFARFYRIPSMNHCSGGPATDQFDMLTPLVDWVERGKPPRAVIANVRGPGNAAGANPDVPATWSATRSRPLCPYPQVARYRGRGGSIETAESFRCE